METKHYVDIAVIIIVAVLGLRGLKNGLIHEIMGVLGIVIGIYCASKYCIDGAKYIELAGLSFENRHVLLMLSFILILSVVWIGFLVLGVIAFCCDFTRDCDYKLFWWLCIFGIKIFCDFMRCCIWADTGWILKRSH